MLHGSGPSLLDSFNTLKYLMVFLHVPVDLVDQSLGSKVLFLYCMCQSLRMTCYTLSYTLYIAFVLSLDQIPNLFQDLITISLLYLDQLFHRHFILTTLVHNSQTCSTTDNYISSSQVVFLLHITQQPKRLIS